MARCSGTTKKGTECRLKALEVSDFCALHITQDPDAPSGREAIEELEKFKTWWLVACGGDVDLCTRHPGKDVDLYINTRLRTLVEVWNGDVDLKKARHEKKIRTRGSPHLAKTMPDWLGISPYADIRPAEAATPQRG